MVTSPLLLGKTDHFGIDALLHATDNVLLQIGEQLQLLLLTVATRRHCRLTMPSSRCFRRTSHFVWDADPQLVI